MLVLEWWSASSKDSMTAKPGGTFEEDWWRTMSGLIKRITFPSEVPGGWLLPEDMRQVPNPVKTRPNRWTGQSLGNSVPFLKLKLICSLSAQITSFHQGYLCLFHFFILVNITLLLLPVSWDSFIFGITRLHPAPSVYFCLLSDVFLKSSHFISFELPPSPSHSSTSALLRYSILSQLWQAMYLFALQDETVVEQRCQIFGYEHLEDVNVINANQILLTAAGRRLGLGWETCPQEKWSKNKAKECQWGNERDKGGWYMS